MSAMLAAASELHPTHTFSFEGISISGRLDRLIWRELMTRAGVDPSLAHHDRFRHSYGEHLQRGFESSSRSNALVGARELVEAVAAHGRCGVGLLTGNYEHTGRMKLRQAGFALEHFEFNAWADDGEHRRDLPRVAIDRHRRASGHSLDPTQVIVIGDTPLDIDCARFNGCLSIAVATGQHPMAELESHRPDLAVTSLAEWQTVLSWITGR